MAVINAAYGHEKKVTEQIDSLASLALGRRADRSRSSSA